jgi:TM2 domain-containing membrane protein YozV
MSASVCPYCRGTIEQDEPQTLLCPVCDTPHHADCFEENGGCTVFGCEAAPAAEPKLSIGAPDLEGSATASSAPPAASNTVPPPPFIGSVGAPPPPRLAQAEIQATEPPGGPPMFNSWGYSLLAHPLPDQEPQRAPIFSSLGYGPAQPVAYQTPQPRLAGPARTFDPTLPAKNRTVFLLLGVLLGAFGAHSFYAGSTKKGLLQLGITVLTLGMAGVMVWIWAVIDICTISTDNDGFPFRN